MKSIAKEINAIRTGKKISQESLACACGLRRKYVGVIEKDDNKISLEVFLNLYSGLQIHPNEILHKFSREDLENLCLSKQLIYAKLWLNYTLELPLSRTHKRLFFKFMTESQSTDARVLIELTFWVK